MEGSPSGTINSLDISPDGERFVSGGNDQLVKLWKYQEGLSLRIFFVQYFHRSLLYHKKVQNLIYFFVPGITTHIGVGHAAVITCTRFSANGKYIVTCDASGGVFVWETPKNKIKEEEQATEVPPPKPQSVKEEDIHDLPSHRSSKSSKSSEESKRSKEDESCRCSAKSSKTFCSERSEGDIDRRSSNHTSQKSVKSKTSSREGNAGNKGLGEAKNPNSNDQKSSKSECSNREDREPVISKKVNTNSHDKNIVGASTKDVKSLKISTPPSRGSTNKD